MTLHRTAATLMVLGLVVALSACGRKSAPEYPEGSTHPKAYPLEYNTPKNDDK